MNEADDLLIDNFAQFPRFCDALGAQLRGKHNLPQRASSDSLHHDDDAGKMPECKEKEEKKKRKLGEPSSSSSRIDIDSTPPGPSSSRPTPLDAVEKVMVIINQEMSLLLRNKRSLFARMHFNKSMLKRLRREVEGLPPEHEDLDSPSTKRARSKKIEQLSATQKRREAFVEEANLFLSIIKKAREASDVHEVDDV